MLFEYPMLFEHHLEIIVPRDILDLACNISSWDFKQFMSK